MELFLEYGRILGILSRAVYLETWTECQIETFSDPDEIELLANKDPSAPKPCPPTIEAFREMIDGYEALHVEIEAIQPYQVFSAFFQVDVRPFRYESNFSYNRRLHRFCLFRQAAVNIVRRWGNMFKDHLVNSGELKEVL